MGAQMGGATQGQGKHTTPREAHKPKGPKAQKRPEGMDVYKLNLLPWSPLLPLVSCHSHTHADTHTQARSHARTQRHTDNYPGHSYVM